MFNGVVFSKMYVEAIFGLRNLKVLCVQASREFEKLVLGMTYLDAVFNISRITQLNLKPSSCGQLETKYHGLRL